MKLKIVTYTIGGGGKIDAKVPADGDGGNSLIPKRSAVSEEGEHSCFLPSIIFLSVSNQKTKLPPKTKEKFKPRKTQLKETDKICRKRKHSRNSARSQ
jgi:hypothetical protein